MTFSIIIPVYNVEQYIRDCLESVIRQAYTDWECICVDDGSTDGSMAILQYFAEKDSRIKVIHTDNQGVSHARNVGLESATGGWIVFVDSDDEISPDYLSKAILTLTQTKADVYAFKPRIIDQDGAASLMFPLVSTSQVLKGDVIKQLRAEGILYPLVSCVWGKVFSRTLINECAIRFNEKMNHGEDTLFSACSLANAKVLCIDIDVNGYSYKRRCGSLATDVSLCRANGQCEYLAACIQIANCTKKIGALLLASDAVVSLFVYSPRAFVKKDRPAYFAIVHSNEHYGLAKRFVFSCCSLKVKMLMMLLIITPVPLWDGVTEFIREKVLGQTK